MKDLVVGARGKSAGVDQDPNRETAGEDRADLHAFVERYRAFLLTAVVLCAVTMQVSFVPARPLALDSSQVLYLASEFVGKGILPVHGILNSLRAYNPPFFVWLYLPPMLLAHDPSWVLVVPALFLHVLALIFIYALGRRYFGTKAGLTGAALYAFSEGGMYFGQSSWAQGLLPPLYVLFIFLLFQWLLGGKGWCVALLLPLASWTSGLHWAGLLLFAVLAALVLLFRPRIHAPSVVAGSLIALSLWVPYLGFEQERAFVDVRALLLGPLDAPAAEGISLFCDLQSKNAVPVEAPSQAPPTDQQQAPDGLKAALESSSPRLYKALCLVCQYSRHISSKAAPAVRGMVRALSVNFRSSSFSSSPGCAGQHALYLVETGLFLAGLGVLLCRVGIKRSASPAECLLLSCFLLPAVLQNLSPHNTLTRPDVSWLLYGPQMLMTAYGCTVLGRRWLRVGSVLVCAAVLLLIGSAAHTAWERISPWSSDPSNPQRQMVAWIAQDLLSQGRRQAAIRYDLLQDAPQLCWVVSYAALEDTYYIGAEHDYLLFTMYGVENTAKSPDGWASAPDYVVLRPEGLSRYAAGQGRMQARHFGGYVVLKSLE